MKNDPIETALAALDEVPLQTPEGRKQIEKALSSKFNLVSAKAARMVAETQWLDLAPALAAAFDRIMKAGNPADKGCSAKIAIARALVGLDHDDASLYLRGMKHVQMEPVWGGSEDRAAELRSVCAIGWVNSRVQSKLSPLVDLLADPEWVARVGAAKAIGAMGGEGAAMVLKLKCLMGDRGPNELDVIAECYQALLQADPETGVALVAGIAARDPDEEKREAAILALGSSRRPEAIGKLKELFEATASAKLRSAILLSLATARSESATQFVLEQVRSGGSSACSMAVKALAAFKNNSALRAEVETALQARGDAAGAEAFRSAF